ncbi:uncharacterized protein METZ01_LOCUS492490 [marine metagenome]|uniref:Uncharacterized protein n=1 Tax=marine metagenome TaxID=408172 RepID=A0A383D504_9ZZZZ
MKLLLLIYYQLDLEIEMIFRELPYEKVPVLLIKKTNNRLKI